MSDDVPSYEGKIRLHDLAASDENFLSSEK